MNIKTKNLLQIHIAVFLLGFSGLFGRLVSTSIFTLILGRTFFSSLALFLLLKYQNISLKLEKPKEYFYLIILGIFLSLHWITFFHSINLSTVAIGLLTFSTFPFFVTFLEPIIFKEKLYFSDIVVAIIAFIGISFVVPSFDFENDMTIGGLWGIFSGILYAIFSLGNRAITQKYSGPLVSFYEQLVVMFSLIPTYLITREIVTRKDIFLMALLGIVFTALAHTLVISSLKHVKAKTSSIIFCLEPLYSITAAAFILNEIPSIKTLFGGVIIICTVLYSTIKSKK